MVVSFPPDENVRSRLVCARSRMRRASPYLSSTAVYPATVGVVTERRAPVSDSTERASKRLAAERTWREAGASIVRLPAFYGLSTGLHVSLARGSFRMPGSGSNIVSRVHEDDAARFVCAALRAPPRSLLLAGDDEPAAVADVVEFVCALFGLALPVSSEGEQIPLSLPRQPPHRQPRDESRPRHPTRVPELPRGVRGHLHREPRALVSPPRERERSPLSSLRRATHPDDSGPSPVPKIVHVHVYVYVWEVERESGEGEGRREKEIHTGSY